VFLVSAGYRCVLSVCKYLSSAETIVLRTMPRPVTANIRFYPQSVHVGFLGQRRTKTCFPPSTSASLVSISPSMLHAHSFIHSFIHSHIHPITENRCYVILAIYNFFSYLLFALFCLLFVFFCYSCCFVVNCDVLCIVYV
jgi:hypothetical protein